MAFLNLDAVVARVQSLPALPAVISELLECFGNDDASICAIAERVAHDQGLSAQVLRLANSSFYGMMSEVKTIQDAIAVLGLRSTQTLVTAVAVRNRFRDVAAEGFDPEAFWRHSIGTALAARAIARARSISADCAFTAGLLHDIGRLVLAAEYPEYGDVLVHRRERDCTLVQAEYDMLGVDHAVVGQALARHWRFPPLVQEAVGGHHAPTLHSSESLAGLVHVADAVAYALGLDGDDEFVPPVSAAAWRQNALDDARWTSALAATEAQFEGVCAALMV